MEIRYLKIRVGLLLLFLPPISLGIILASTKISFSCQREPCPRFDPMFPGGRRSDEIAWRASGNGGPWGNELSGWRYCPPGTWVTGYKMRVEQSQGRGDDTGLNAVSLRCRDRNWQNRGLVEPGSGFWGDWSSEVSCSPGSFVTHFQLQVEPSQGSGDDTAANSVAFWCNNQKRIEAAGGTPWGGWGNWQGGFNNAAVCGILVKVESQQGRGDDTALNEIELAWCRF
jgi:Vitelline membrane outer layer protein I (VOMI)